MTHGAADPIYFDYATLTTEGRFWGQYAAVLREQLPTKLNGGQLYGAFAPQFGLASNQLVLMTCWDRREGVERTIEETLSAVEGVIGVAHHLVVPTARPETSEPPRRKGIYVHRWFDVEPRHVDEIVELSSVAWETFEKTFEVEVVGFFRTLDDGADVTQLMLLNWYPSLAAWEASRNFEADPASRTRFARRAELTMGTRAITTQLAW